MIEVSEVEEFQRMDRPLPETLKRKFPALEKVMYFTVRVLM